jgi:hypothetical protein
MKHQPHRPITAEEAVLIRYLAEQGHGPSYIARQLGRGIPTVRCWLERHDDLGEVLRRRVVLRAAIRDLLARAPWLDNAEVARRFATSAETVRRTRLGKLPGQSERFSAAPAEWADEPCGRIKALRQAHGIEP